MLPKRATPNKMKTTREIEIQSYIGAHKECLLEELGKRPIEYHGQVSWQKHDYTMCCHLVPIHGNPDNMNGVERHIFCRGFDTIVGPTSALV
jgi:hypothetical protein